MTCVQRTGASERSEIHRLSFNLGADTFFCDAFGCAPIGPLLENNNDTVMCSVAKVMVEKYNIGLFVMGQASVKQQCLDKAAEWIVNSCFKYSTTSNQRDGTGVHQLI
jgi:hypothetical protein